MSGFTRPHVGKSLATLLMIGLLAFGIPSGALASEALSSTERSALREFRANLTAASDIASFEKLTGKQQVELASYLLGEIDPFAEAAASPTSAAGDFRIRTERKEIASSKQTLQATAASTSRSVSAWQSFLFAGITISKTTVRLTYTTSGGSARSISSYSCILNQNYDPFASISLSKDGAWVSSGKATAECLVKVKRGVPTPWGTVSWSTRSNVQYVTGNGYGSVTSHGWR